MFCEKCGTKNTREANFCGSCGHKLKDASSTKEKPAKNSVIANLPKRTKIVMVVVLVIVVIALVVLGILLNNPVKKLEDKLVSYYDNYEEKRIKELVDIGKILKDNREDEKVLNNIKESVNNMTGNWVKNFNREYSDVSNLDDTYARVSGVLKNIYDYYNGLPYMLDYDLYKEYNNTLKTLYYSKSAYFKAVDYEKKEDLYNAYYFYQKVNEEDCYYKKAQEYIAKYVKDEVAQVMKKADEVVANIDNLSNEEKLKAYIDKLKYLNDNKYV
ncbi:MAG: zinc ribbon domain-containing protein, partial [Bacilli bacterium]|nr:zinc ribbon domain-containing protein [Bacilli bacterium]